MRPISLDFDHQTWWKQWWFHSIHWILTYFNNQKTVRFHSPWRIHVNGRLMLTKLGFLFMVNVTKKMAYIRILWVGNVTLYWKNMGQFMESSKGDGYMAISIWLSWVGVHNGQFTTKGPSPSWWVDHKKLRISEDHQWWDMAREKGYMFTGISPWGI